MNKQRHSLIKKFSAGLADPRKSVWLLTTTIRTLAASKIVVKVHYSTITIQEALLQEITMDRIKVSHAFFLDYLYITLFRDEKSL
jgi:hypothetical protein